MTWGRGGIDDLWTTLHAVYADRDAALAHAADVLGDITGFDSIDDALQHFNENPGNLARVDVLPVYSYLDVTV
jgi:hypothetical protein